MTAPSGNKNGRPVTVSLSPEDMIKLGEEMIEWVILNQPLHLSQWYTIEKMITYNTWKTYIQNINFFPYYERALKIVGIQYLDKNSDIRDGISQRWQRVYFKDLRDSEDLDVDNEYARKLKLIADEARLKAELGNQTPEETKAQLDSLLTLIASSQSSRKMEANKSKDEIKS